MIEEWAAKLGAHIDSSRPIQFGTQYRLTRDAEQAIVNVYHGKADWNKLTTWMSLGQKIDIDRIPDDPRVN